MAETKAANISKQAFLENGDMFPKDIKAVLTNADGTPLMNAKGEPVSLTFTKRDFNGGGYGYYANDKALMGVGDDGSPVKLQVQVNISVIGGKVRSVADGTVDKTFISKTEARKAAEAAKAANG